MRNVRRATVWIVAVTGLVAAGGCAPRMVTRITGSQDQVKLVYNRSTIFGSSSGVVQCKRDQEGNLAGCRDLNIQFNSPKD